jgi:hypothetical protein
LEQRPGQPAGDVVHGKTLDTLPEELGTLYKKLEQRDGELWNGARRRLQSGRWSTS